MYAPEETGSSKTFDLSRALASQFLGLEPYTPIEPVDVLARRLGVAEDAIIKLDGNENPYGPSPKAIEALATFPWYHIYPDPLQRDLRHALAGYAGASTDHIVVGNGSDELIDLVMRLVLTPGDRVISCPPTFGMYPFNTAVCGGELVEIPRTEDFSLDLRGIKRAVDSRTKLVIIASPNNPTGNAASAKEIETLLSAGVLVVVDEAYCEFAESSVASMAPAHDNLVVLRTFSKWAGLAGLRVGYGIFPPELAEIVLRMKPPYNVNVAGLVAAKATLEDVESQQRSVQAIIKERDNLFAQLSTLSFLRPLPSQANFILCLMEQGSAADLRAFLLNKGILIKQIESPPLANAVRISVGRPQDTASLVKAMEEWNPH